MFTFVHSFKSFLHILFSFIFLIISVTVNGQKNRLFESYDVKFYFIDIEANNVNTDIKGNSEVLLELKETNVDSIALEFTKNAVIDSILINNVALNYNRKEDTLIVPLTEGNVQSDYFNIIVYYSISGINSSSGKGISNRLNSLGSRVTWTITEPFYAKNWFPCKQVLTDKADSAYIYITVPDTLMAGSNGILTHISQMPDQKKRFEWKTNYPIDFYLISFAVANYMDYSFYVHIQGGDSILVQNFIYNDSSYFWNYKGEIDSTKSLITSFSKRFGPYPFRKEKYGHCLTPGGGGMENQTMTSLNSFNFELVAHELAHQWFGDNVTCSDWQYIWINEGFASYGELVAYEELGKIEDLQDWISWAQTTAKSVSEGSVYVPDEKKTDDKRIFDHSLSYKKGALIIHMIRYIINDDNLFFEILQDFQSKYADSNASAEDFKKLVEEKSHINFDRFFEQWYYGEGFPTLKINWEQSHDTVYIYIDQLASAPEITPFFDLQMDFRFDYFEGDSLILIKLTEPSQKVAIPFTKRINKIVADPDQWILKNLDGVHRMLPDNTHDLYSIFPNPADTEVYIEDIELGKPYLIKIFDIKGIKRFEMKSNETYTRINLEEFESGIYQIVIYEDDMQEIYHLVKT